MSQPVVLLDVPEVLRRIGLSRSALYRLIDKGRFPKAVYPSPKAPRWRSDAIGEMDR